MTTVLSTELKKQLLQQCKSDLDAKIALMHAELVAITESINTETKSSVGDKHETARARMQAEQEKLGRQLAELTAQKKELERIDPSVPHTLAGPGSLISTNMGIFFISVALGKVMADHCTVYAISPLSPLASAIKGLAAGGSFSLNGAQYTIGALS